jgi:membrane protein
MSLNFTRLMTLLLKLVRAFEAARVTLLAASLSYFVFFSLLPLMVLLVAVAGQFLSQEEAMARTYELIREAIPHQRELVTSALQGVVAHREGAGLVSLLALAWGAKNVFMSLSQAMNEIWRVPGRPWLQENLRALAAAVVSGVLVAAGSGVTGALHAVMALPLPLTGLKPEAIPGAVPLIAMLTPPVVTFALLCVLYSWLPNRHTRLSQAWFPAAVATLAWEATSVGFGWYLGHVAGLSWVYGSLGGIVGLLMWLYLSSIIVLSGVVLMRTLDEPQPGAENP